MTRRERGTRRDGATGSCHFIKSPTRKENGAEWATCYPEQKTAVLTNILYPLYKKKRNINAASRGKLNEQS